MVSQCRLFMWYPGTTSSYRCSAWPCSGSHFRVTTGSPGISVASRNTLPTTLNTSHSGPNGCSCVTAGSAAAVSIAVSSSLLPSMPSRSSSTTVPAGVIVRKSPARADRLERPDRSDQRGAELVLGSGEPRADRGRADGHQPAAEPDVRHVELQRAEDVGTALRGRGGEGLVEDDVAGDRRI